MPARPSADPRQQRKSLQREWMRDRILDSSLPIFASNGYHGTTMQHVAAASGFSVGQVYNVVGNKLSLFEAVMAREGRRFESAVAGVLDDTSRPPGERFDSFVERTFAFFDEHRDSVRIYVNDFGGVRETAGERFNIRGGMRERLDRRMTALLEEAVRTRQAVAMDPAELASALQDLVNSFIVAWVRRGFRGNLSDRVPVVQRLVWKGIQPEERDHS